MQTTTDSTQGMTLTEDEFAHIVDNNAKKLAVLLYASTMPDEVKEAFIDVLSVLTIEQISEFLDILDTKYADQETRGIDKEYQDELVALCERFKQEEEQMEKQLEESLMTENEILRVREELQTVD